MTLYLFYLILIEVMRKMVRRYLPTSLGMYLSIKKVSEKFCYLPRLFVAKQVGSTLYLQLYLPTPTSPLEEKFTLLANFQSSYVGILHRQWIIFLLLYRSKYYFQQVLTILTGMLTDLLILNRYLLQKQKKIVNKTN